MKIFTATQIHELDKYTIANEPISSLDLMERAAKALTRAITECWSTKTHVVVFAGPGNNGGDALAVARMMAELSYHVTAYLFNITGSLSPDCAANKRRLQEIGYYNGEVTPVYDEATAKAVKAFQNAVDLPADGIASLETQRELFYGESFSEK